MNGNKIFISHSGEESEWVRDFAAALRSRGSQVWLDEWRLRPGEPIQEEMEKGLRESDIVTFVVTPQNVHRGNFLFELGAAIGMGPCGNKERERPGVAPHPR
jgi:uncharacterized damage-inducible protein DinB